MNFIEYLRSRFRRELSFLAIGPNEARLFYDLSAGIGALVLSLLFNSIFLRGEVGWPPYLLPIALMGFNFLFGIYSKLKTAAGRVKAAALSASVCCSCLLLWFLSRNTAIITLWAIIAAPPLILARILLNLPYSRHKNLAVSLVKQRGPVLVIGGAGYIGTHVVEALLRDGQAVRVLDRLMYGREAIGDFLANRNFALIEGDATDIAKLTMSMQGVSAVVHLAGLVGDPACAVDTQFTRHTNIIATRMAKEIAQSMGIYRFIFASSCSVYGVSDKEVREEDELNPVSLYAQTKIDSEKELLFSARDDFFVTILRFATVFGHSRRPRFDLVANLFTAQAITNGVVTVIGPYQWRPFIHVRDLARSVLAVLKANPTHVQSQIFNVGDKRLNMTILQLAEIVKKIVEKQGVVVNITVEENPQDQRNYAVSFEKIHSMLGFEAETLMEEGIREIAVNFKLGKYGDYREQIYSNVAMTKITLSDFNDPLQSIRLYAPLDSRFLPISG